MRRKGESLNVKEPLGLEGVHPYASPGAPIRSQEEIHTPQESTYPSGPLWQWLRECQITKNACPSGGLYASVSRSLGNLSFIDVHSPFPTIGPGMTRIISVHVSHHKNPRSCQSSLISWDTNLHTEVHVVFHSTFQPTISPETHPLCPLALCICLEQNLQLKKQFFCSKNKSLFVCEVSFCFLIQKKAQISLHNTVSPAGQVVTIFSLMLLTPPG